MADFSKLNGYNVKDSYARSKITQLANYHTISSNIANPNGYSWANGGIIAFKNGKEIDIHFKNITLNELATFLIEHFATLTPYTNVCGTTSMFKQGSAYAGFVEIANFLEGMETDEVVWGYYYNTTTRVTVAGDDTTFKINGSLHYLAINDIPLENIL